MTKYKYVYAIWYIVYAIWYNIYTEGERALSNSSDRASTQAFTSLTNTHASIY